MDTRSFHRDADNTTGWRRERTRGSEERLGRAPGTLTHDLEPRTVLLAQDDQDSLEIFGIVLRSAGYRVLTAHSGEDAVRLALQEEADLVFTEAQLPFVDGWRLIEVLHGEPSLGRTRFVLLTAWVDQDQAQRARAAGFDGYLPKPVAPMRVLRETQRLIGLASPTHLSNP